MFDDGDVDVRDLARRVARLEAIQEIERLKYRYWRACDSKDPDAFRECFVSEGADIDYGPGLGGFDDREKLVELYSKLALRRDGDRWLYNDIHHGMHPDIELIDANTAVGSWTFWFMRVNLADGVVEQASLEYRDRYLVEDGKWKIQSSHVTPLTGVNFPIPEGANVAPGPAVPQ
ncbi:nuclear transport factor 2 family protein [Saccharopolyspora elongata]|uniref:nuclear transport factor 2 family protein n=1 Tax=Saccharopolyspora elongata TaxID=2530387 RepID=UPI001A9FEBFA|nr:nuclear transport factor 2 family protein [Saccharopolyspora elongata]